MIANHPPDPNAPPPRRSNADLWAGLIILLVVLGLAFIPYKFPGVFGLADRDFRHFLTMRLFSLGQVSISILFLLKAIIFFLVLGILATRIRRTLYHRLRRTAMRDARAFLLARFISMSFYAFGLLLGLEWTGLNLNTIAIVGGTLGIGIGFGLQQIVANWVAGLVLLIEQPVRIGDVISVRDLNGTIIRIGGRSTWVRTYDDEVVIIPNSDLTNHQVLNWTADDLKVRLSIPIGVGYGSDIDQVRTALLQIADDNPQVLKAPPPEVIFEDLGDSSLNFRLRFYAVVHPDRDNYCVKSDLLFAIVKRCRELGIELPFPQRDLHIRSSALKSDSIPS